MQREIFIRGSRYSNLSSNFLRRSLRSLTQFKSSSVCKSSSLSWGGGWKRWDLKYLVFLFPHYSYFLQYEHHS
ncbi:hypothetical protein C2R86_02665 [Helicobacter pylori]|nr:hypothetical protein C2R86_02665 [Helicobacter pylori]